MRSAFCVRRDEVLDEVADVGATAEVEGDRPRERPRSAGVGRCETRRSALPVKGLLNSTCSVIELFGWNPVPIAVPCSRDSHPRHHVSAGPAGAGGPASRRCREDPGHQPPQRTAPGAGIRLARQAPVQDSNVKPGVGYAVSVTRARIHRADAGERTIDQVGRASNVASAPRLTSTVRGVAPGQV